MAIGSLLIAILGAVWMLIRALDWKGLFSGAKALIKDFSKDNAVNFVKSNKKAVCIVAVLVCVMLIIADNLLYEPVDVSYRKSDYDYNYDYSQHEWANDCPKCLGTGICFNCDGSGMVSNYGFTVECTACDKWGNCSSCDGTGKK